MINHISYGCLSFSYLNTELTFTQSVTGKYHSFDWRSSLISSEYNGELANFPFQPKQKEDYLQIVERVLISQIPQQYCGYFEYNNQSVLFQLVINPIILPNGSSNLVLVTGNQLSDCNGIAKTESHSLPTNNSISYQKLLIRIAKKIRRTLNLEIIWQQTVNSMGQDLQVDQCLLLVPTNETNYLEVKAEYSQDNHFSLLGHRLNIQDYEEITKTILSRQPQRVVGEQHSFFKAKSILLVPTFYQREFNGLICLSQFEEKHSWDYAELELIQELGDQVGTAMAHATIYQKLEFANIQAKEASRLKSEFLASTSHELRTPLNGILGFLRLVLDDMADDEQEEREFIGQAYDSALHLLNLINDILDIAKIEAGKMDFKITSIFLDKIYEDVYKFAHSQANQKNLQFKINLPENCDRILVYADSQRLLQVMLNLIGNSLKFTHEGSIEIDTEIICTPIQLHEETLPGMVKITVEDTGIGVSLDKQERLFETFYQVDGSRTKTYGGTGLGLAISKRLVEGMGGKISFYSMGEELGSTITVTIPLAQLPTLKQLN